MEKRGVAQFFGQHVGPIVVGLFRRIPEAEGKPSAAVAGWYSNRSSEAGKGGIIRYSAVAVVNAAGGRREVDRLCRTAGAGRWANGAALVFPFYLLQPAGAHIQVGTRTDRCICRSVWSSLFSRCWCGYSASTCIPISLQPRVDDVLVVPFQVVAWNEVVIVSGKSEDSRPSSCSGWLLLASPTSSAMSEATWWPIRWHSRAAENHRTFDLPVGSLCV